MASIIFLLFWWMVWLVPHPRQLGARSVWYICCIAGILFFGIRTQKEYYNLWYPQTYCVSDCNIYLGPDLSYVTFGTLSAGEPVRVYEKHTDWCKIKKQDNTVGWVQTTNIHVEKQ